MAQPNVSDGQVKFEDAEIKKRRSAMTPPIDLVNQQQRAPQPMSLDAGRQFVQSVSAPVNLTMNATGNVSPQSGVIAPASMQPERTVQGVPQSMPGQMVSQDALLQMMMMMTQPGGMVTPLTPAQPMVSPMAQRGPVFDPNAAMRSQPMPGQMAQHFPTVPPATPSVSIGTFPFAFAIAPQPAPAGAVMAPPVSAGVKPMETQKQNFQTTPQFMMASPVSAGAAMAPLMSAGVKPMEPQQHNFQPAPQSAMAPPVPAGAKPMDPQQQNFQPAPQSAMAPPVPAGAKPIEPQQQNFQPIPQSAMFPPVPTGAAMAPPMSAKPMEPGQQQFQPAPHPERLQNFSGTPEFQQLPPLPSAEQVEPKPQIRPDEIKTRELHQMPSRMTPAAPASSHPGQMMSQPPRMPPMVAERAPRVNAQQSAPESVMVRRCSSLFAGCSLFC